jgi:hypothetical protein
MIYVYEEQAWEYNVVLRSVPAEELLSEQELNELGHFPSDVVFGATVGAIAGRTVTRHGKEYYADWQFVPGGGVLTFVLKSDSVTQSH